MQKEDKVKKFWNENIKEDYRESGTRFMSFPFFEFGNDLEFSRLKRLINPNKTTDVLEFGCGSGRLTVLLSPHVNKIIAVDIAENQLNQLREEILKRNGTNIEIYLSDALSFETTAKYDVIFLDWFTYHLNDDELSYLVCKIKTYLKPDGEIVSKDTLSLLNSISLETKDYYANYRTIEKLTSIYNKEGLSNLKRIHPYFNVYDLVFIRLGIKNTPKFVYKILKTLEPLFIKFYIVVLYLYKLLNKEGPSYYQEFTTWKPFKDDALSATDIMSYANPFSFLDYVNYKFGSILICYIQKLNITANQITLTSLTVFIFGLYGLVKGNPWLFSLCTIISFTLDNMDGMWARLKKQQSDFGGFLDEFCDTIKEYAVDGAMFLFYYLHILYYVKDIKLFLTLIFAYFMLKSVFYIYSDKKSVRAWFNNKIRIITYSPAERHMIILPLVVFSFKLFAVYYLFVLVAYGIAVLNIIKTKYSVANKTYGSK